ncbi:MAG: HD domain-containing protein, partial [Candidatus Paceibacterota bacterium]
MKKKNENKQIVNFLFEVGTMRKLPRIHQQVLLSQDLSDNIATHSYRVSLIAWFLAKMEKVDPYKTMMMAFLHDVKEVRSGD